jgi:hypothetical protein
VEVGRKSATELGQAGAKRLRQEGVSRKARQGRKGNLKFLFLGPKDIAFLCGLCELCEKTSCRFEKT